MGGEGAFTGSLWESFGRMSDIQITANTRRDHQKARDRPHPNILARGVRFGDCSGTFIFCLHLAPLKLMGMWFPLLWEVSCDSPFTLQIEKGANHGHLLSTPAWVTAPAQAVSVAAGECGPRAEGWFDSTCAQLSSEARAPEENGKLFSSLLSVTSNLCVSFLSHLPLPPSCWW